MQTTEEILHTAFKSETGLRAAAGLARMGSLFLDQLLTDPKQMAEQNLVKQYLRQAGFEVRIVQKPQPVQTEQPGNVIDGILEGRAE